MTSALRDIAGRFAGRRILVLGDVMLDEYVHGDCSRISPEAPVPVVMFQERSFRAGGAANAALNVSALGGDVVVIGVTGSDENGETLRTIVEDARGATRFVAAAGRPTITKTRIVSNRQQIVRIDREVAGPFEEEVESELIAEATASLVDCDALLVSDYGKGVVSERVARTVVAHANERGIPTVVDPKGVDFGKYRGATVVTPNTIEAVSAAHPALVGSPDLALVAEALLKLLAPAAILVTRGADGMTLFADGAPPEHVPSSARAVFDVTGAGDTVAGALALALAAGADLPSASRLANAAAGVAVGRPGTATVSVYDLLAELGV